MDSDLDLAMDRAIELAKKAWGETHPNPMVGAVILEKGEIVAEGWHKRSGGDHAEIAVIKALGRAPADDAVLCVTLEPCSTKGRTGACTDAIIKNGFKRVVVGTTDPNPEHCGHGIEILRNAGIEVIENVRERECRDLNLIFNHWIVQNRPLIAAKIATTLDGKIATRTGHSKWITGPEARKDAHRWRKLFPAIACGSGTLTADNPALTSRLDGQSESSGRRFIFDRTLGAVGALTAQVFQDDFRSKTTVVTWENAAPDRVARLKKQDIGVWQLPANPEDTFFKAFSNKCAEEGITGVLVEGGPRLLSAMLAARQLDYLFAYRAPKLLADDEALACFVGQSFGEIQEAFQLHDVRHNSFGDDQLLRGYFVKP